MHQLKKRIEMKNGILTLLLILLLLFIMSPFDIFNNNLNPLIFGFSFCIVNRKLLKYKFLTGMFFSILLSYTAFFIGLLSLFGIAKLVDNIIEILNLKNFDENIYFVVSGLIASLSLYLFFTKVFFKQNIKSGFLIMLFSYVLIPLLVFILPFIFHRIIITEFFIVYNLAWLIIESFFLSYVFNQNRTLENEYLKEIKPNA